MTLTLLRHAEQKPPLGPRKLDPDNPLNQKIAGFWVFNEVGSRIVNDISGNGLNLALTGPTSTWKSSIVGPISQGDAATIYWEGPASSPWITGPFTLWCYMILGPSGGGDSAILGTDYGNGRVQFFTNFQNTTSWNLWGDSGSPTSLTTATFRPAGPHILGGSWDPVSSTALLYLDGILVSSGTLSVGAYTNTARAMNSLDNPHWSTAFSQHAIVAGGVWGRVLSASEQEELASKPFRAVLPLPKQRWWFMGGGGGGTTFTLSVGGSVTPSGILVKQDGKILTGSETASGILLKRTSKSLAGGETATGALIKLIGKPSLAGSETPSGILVRQTGKVLGGSETATGTVTKRNSKAFTGSNTPAGVLIKLVTKAFSGSETATGTLSVLKVALRTFTGSVTPTGTLVKQIGKTLTSANTPTGILIKLVTKSFTGSETATGTITLLKVVLRSFSGSTTPTGTLVKQVGKALTGTSTPTGTLVRFISKTLVGSESPAGTLVKRIGKSFSGSEGPTGTVSNQFQGAGFTINVGGSVTPSGVLKRLVGKKTSGQVTPAGIITKKLPPLTFGGILTAVGTLIRNFIAAGGARPGTYYADDEVVAHYDAQDERV